MLELDGGYGEGGGQIIRSACSLAALTGKPVRITAIRANRKQPGLKAQHVTAVRAAARLCAADLRGDAIGSSTLLFYPHQPVQHGEYVFDVSVEAQAPSAGSVVLIAQTLLPALITTPGHSRIVLRGGTDVPFSPPIFYFTQVYLPMLEALGAQVRLEIVRHGFYPNGGGEVILEVTGVPALQLPEWSKAAVVKRLHALIYVNVLPESVVQRLRERTEALLKPLNLPMTFEIRPAPAPSSGIGLLLTVHTSLHRAGFTALGRRGWPIEGLAEQAVQECKAYLQSRTFWEKHLADQMVLPLMLCGTPSRTSVTEVTQHLLTNVWVANHFLKAQAYVAGEEGQPGTLTITP